MTKKKPLQVLHLTTDSAIGGTEHLLIWISRNYNHELFEMSFCSIHPEGKLQKVLKRKGEKTYFLNVRKFIQFFTARKRLKKIIHNIKPDILHTHLLYAGLLGLSLLWGNKNIKLVHTRHYGSFYKKYGNSLKKFFDFILVKMSPKIIAVSQAVKDDLMGRLHVPPERTLFLSNAVDFDLIQKQMEEEPCEKIKMIQKDPSSPKLGVIANFHPCKGHRVLLSALQEIFREMPRCKIFLVGKGEGEKKIQKEVHNLGFQENVAFLGFFDNIFHLFSQLDLLIVPSREEGFGLVILEGMALRVPILASDISPFKEMIQDGVDGWLFQDGNPNSLFDKMQQVFQDNGNRNKVIENAFRKVKKIYSIQKMVSGLESVYFSLS